MNNLIVNIYIFVSFLSMYNLKNKSIILYLLLILQLMMFTFNLYFLLKKKDIKISKDVFFILFVTIFSLVFNISTAGNYLINIVLIFNIYILTKYKWNYIYIRMFLFAIIFNIINIYIYIRARVIKNFGVSNSSSKYFVNSNIFFIFCQFNKK